MVNICSAFPEQLAPVLQHFPQACSVIRVSRAGLAAVNDFQCFRLTSTNTTTVKDRDSSQANSAP